MAKALLLKTDSIGFNLVNIKSWTDIAPLLDADFFDITRALIGGVEFQLYVDDEGLLKDNPIPMSFDKGDLQPMLAGNILVLQSDAVGDSRDLTDEEIDILYNNTVHIYDFHGYKPEGRLVLMLDPRPVVRRCGNCPYFTEDVMHKHFCGYFTNHPTVYAETECYVALPPVEEGGANV